MTKWRVWSMAIASSLVLAACSADTEPTPTVDETPSAQEKSAENKATPSEETTQPTEPAETGTPTKTADSNEMQQKMDELQYEEFELQVEYADHTEYEAEIEKKADGSIKAEIEDSLKGVEQKGPGAFNELFPILKQLDITQQTDKEQVIANTLSAFNLPTDYTEFELEIRFKDGTKIEYEEKR